MSWSYNPITQSTESSTGIVKREQIEEATHVLYEAGIRNQLLIVDVLKALSGLSKGEIKFNVELELKDR